MATLTVPPEHVALVRAAALAELADCGAWLAENAEAAARSALAGELRDVELADLSAPVRWVGEGFALAERLSAACATAASEPVELEAGAGLLASLAELTARSASRRLGELTRERELDQFRSRELSRLCAAIEWAGAEAASLNGARLRVVS